MGQQQLLLILLVTIIVGIATVVAINTFSASFTQSNKDSVRSDLALLASSAQSYYLKPNMLGGGGNSFNGFTFHKVTFPADEITADGLHARNANGIYHIHGATDEEINVYGEPIYEIDSTVDINTLVSDSDYFDVTITQDSIAWVHTY